MTVRYSLENPLGHQIMSSHSITVSINPLYTGGLFHCYMLDKFICHFRGIGSILTLLLYFLWKILLANNVNPDQMPHYLAFDLSLHCLPMTLFMGFQDSVNKLTNSEMHVRNRSMI